MDKTRLFPSSSPHLPTVSTPLSILDATVARFSATGAVWLFEHIPEDINETEFIDRLCSSFVDALGDFEHWAGQLQWAPVRPGGSHTQRFNRPIIIYGDYNDPGVEWSVVRHPSIPVQSLAPSASERALGKGVWIGDDFAQSLFLSDTPLPLHDLREFEDLPAMQIQLNLFNDGGYGIGIKMAHSLADAQSLMVFVHHWAAKSRKLFSSTDTSSLMDAPIFDPRLLDTHAAGDIDGPAADPALVSIARQLPLHRFDWWRIDDPGYSDFSIPATENSKPSPEILSQVEISPSTPGPWTTWDISRPVRYTQLHYHGTELDRLKEQARADGRPDISRLDALLAHMWAVINRARGHGDSTEDVFLNITLGARARVSPPLPESFIGSPVFNTHIKASGASVCDSSVGQTASQIRDTMLQFTPDAMGAMLHDAAHEVSPQRLWQAFLGTQHTLATSWLRLKVYQVDFVGSKQQPRYVHAVMPKMDGCLQVMDSGVDDGGIDIALYLDAEAMENLLVDKKLHV
ncbi:uncharacterized protein TRUGW13939_08690 [Talaromyces rugulosus]|uniref:Transferase family protein n=1 Tax=Talaromyces rugulosus TaxID=121627 RepID=A0A7H8R6G3_TALRU|nr:uncharacterized protein TRUGW13939_08690 [Talaromyces rugulosus]QKX61538.1 hypothetical protein TRUGW13939_08690 [Talaromyces rugulosus]